MGESIGPIYLKYDDDLVVSGPNAVIQALYSIEPLTRFLLKKIDFYKESSTASAYATLVKDLNTIAPLTNAIAPVDTSSFITTASDNGIHSSQSEMNSFTSRLLEHVLDTDIDANNKQEIPKLFKTIQTVTISVRDKIDLENSLKPILSSSLPHYLVIILPRVEETTLNQKRTPFPLLLDLSSLISQPAAQYAFVSSVQVARIVIPSKELAANDPRKTATFIRTAAMVKEVYSSLTKYDNTWYWSDDKGIENSPNMVSNLALGGAVTDKNKRNYFPTVLIYQNIGEQNMALSDLSRQLDIIQNIGQ